ncbi:MAG: hypothetical protein AAF636_11570 [Pseudomonadota bacterium]
MGGKSAPDPPDYAQANREAIYADIETLPDRYAAQAEWEPLLLQLMLESQANAADYTADRMLDVQERYGPGFIQARQQELDMSDPMGQTARQALYDQVMYDLTGEVPDRIDYEVIYPEVVGESVGGNVDIDARINEILGPRPGESNSDLGPIIEALYPDRSRNISSRRQGSPSQNRAYDSGQRERRNELYDYYGIDQPNGKGDEPSTRPLGEPGALSASEWDERAAQLREQFEAGSSQRGMPEVREIRTPSDFVPNDELYARDRESTVIAETLYDQIMKELGLGAELSDGVRREVQQGVRGGQAARGNILGNSAIYEEAMELGQAGENRQLQRQGQALGFLSSGVTPEDIAYRKRQQAMANLGSFMSGQTPVAQFGQLQGAQQGAAPYAPQNAPQVLDPNAGARGTQFAMQNYSNQLNAWSQQGNPWMQGLGLGISALGIPTGGGSTLATSLFG